MMGMLGCFFVLTLSVVRSFYPPVSGYPHGAPCISCPGFSWHPWILPLATPGSLFANKRKYKEICKLVMTILSYFLSTLVLFLFSGLRSLHFPFFLFFLFFLPPFLLLEGGGLNLQQYLLTSPSWLSWNKCFTISLHWRSACYLLN